MELEHKNINPYVLTASVILIGITIGKVFIFLKDGYINMLKSCTSGKIQMDEQDKVDIIKPKPHIEIKQNQIYDIASKFPVHNIVKRQLAKSCHELKKTYEYDMNIKQKDIKKYSVQLKPDEYFICYGCSRHVQKSHPIYVFSCKKCGRKFFENRYVTRDLTGQIALVTGARTKLGHQIVLKLINAGAIVIGTTRSPENTIKLYSEYDDYDKWEQQLDVYPRSLDFDNHDVKSDIRGLYQYIKRKYEKLDILINCAAQTIRARDKATFYDKNNVNGEENRYGDPKYVSQQTVNSWQMELQDIRQNEMEENYRINTITPLIMIQTMMPLLKMSKINPHVVNVHAKEGLFNVHKTDKHIHLNMAKAGLCMLTRCLVSSGHRTNNNKVIRFHGCDPGWISVDEYYEHDRPWVVPPLDEVDGASRILYPIFKNLVSSKKTRRHYDFFIN